MSKTMILVVDDEESILDFVTMALKYDGYEVSTATSGREALEAYRTHHPALVILDWMLPDLDGLAVCREIRSVSPVPILMLTARAQLEDKVTGLDSGADDYLCKPFKLQELQARVRALLRRTGVETGNTLTFGDLSMNTATRVVTRAESPVEITAREFDLLEMFLRNPRHVLTKEQILNQLWGWEYEGNANVVEVHVSALRSKLGDNERRIIRTVRGTGYSLGG
jgi:two-component system response regulator MprA